MDWGRYPKDTGGRESEDIGGGGAGGPRRRGYCYRTEPEHHEIILKMKTHWESENLKI